MSPSGLSSGAVLLDTDAFSILHRGGARGTLRSLVEGRLPLLSFVTVVELLRGALQASWGEQKRTYLQVRNSYPRGSFEPGSANF